MTRMLLSDVKRFMDYIARKSYALQFINTLIIIGISIYCIQSFNSLNDKLDKIETNIKTKIDHRYFNITRSLEDIHDVRIDTLNGNKRD